MSLPRVLIFGQPFNYKYGGGITLSNLFKGWDKDKIAVATTGHLMYNVTTDVCDTYYQLGNREHQWLFPFNLIQRKFPSGLRTFEKGLGVSSDKNQSGLRQILVNNYFYPALEWLGLIHITSKIQLSHEFKSWLNDFKPEVLYLQVSDRENVLFAQVLCDYLKIPSAIHMMDDWPSTISRKGPFRKYWSRQIDKEFKQLLDKVTLFLSISDSMSSEYLKRYNKRFIAFHNPIDITKFVNCRANDVKKIDDTLKILYIGRIGTANRQSICHFARTVSHLKNNEFTITMEIYTPDIDTPEANEINKLKGMRVNPAVNHESVPNLLMEFDILLLPLDFTENGLKYARYSMPTKASEYMISGTPILVYAPEETAISRFFSENECGHCVTVENENEIKRAIIYLFLNKEYRIKLGQNALKLASELFDAEKVRKEFRELLIHISAEKI